MSVQSKWMIAFLLIVSLSIQGCNIGYNSLLFATKSNIGVDIDTAPPTAEISISRTEGVIEPVFENGKTLPVMAHFSSNVNGLERFAFGVNSAFSTGEAAAALSKFWMANGNKTAGELKWKGVLLTEKPKRIPLFGTTPEEVPYLDKGLVKLVYFGTHSVFGIKVEWKGTTGQYPSAVKVGYNRSELAWAPITMSTNTTPKDNDPHTDDDPAKYPYKASSPSLLAILDTDSSWGMFNDNSNGLLYTQFFATGDAATELALKEDIRDRLQEKFSDSLTLLVKVDGKGKVSSDPVGIDCGDNCREQYSHPGYSVALTATPDAGSSFSGWGGSCSGPAATVNVTLDSAKVCIAKFTTP